MKQILAWAALALASFGGLAAGYHRHLESDPRRVVVVVESSNAMRSAMGRVDAALDEIGARRYHEFALFTDRARVHSWAGRFSPGRISPYGPRDLSGLAALDAQPELAGADEILFLTNAEPAAGAVPSGWTVMRLDR